jgi:hypothetical protein
VSVGPLLGELSRLDRDPANEPPVAICDGDKGTGDVIAEVGVVEHILRAADRHRQGEREDRAEHLGDPDHEIQPNRAVGSGVIETGAAVFQGSGLTRLVRL